MGLDGIGSCREERGHAVASPSRTRYDGPQEGDGYEGDTVSSDGRTGTEFESLGKIHAQLHECLVELEVRLRPVLMDEQDQPEDPDYDPARTSKEPPPTRLFQMTSSARADAARLVARVERLASRVVL